jgi:hypothetical protein
MNLIQRIRTAKKAGQGRLQFMLFCLLLGLGFSEIMRGRLGGPETVLGVLHWLPVVYRSPTVRIVRADEICGQSSRSQDEPCLAPGTARGSTHGAIFDQSRSASNRGKSLLPFQEKPCLLYGNCRYPSPFDLLESFSWRQNRSRQNLENARLRLMLTGGKSRSRRASASMIGCPGCG